MSSHHHILVASRQLWPNITGLVLLRERGDIPDRVVILHTENPTESAGPAERLKDFTRKTLFSNTDISLILLKDSTPKTVKETVNSIITNAPSDARFTINATGGLKTIFAGLLPLVSLNNVEIFYREISGIWYRLLPPDEIGGAINLEKMDVHVSTDDLPVLDLVETQFDKVPGKQWRGDRLPDINAKRLKNLVSSGFECSWQWTRLAESFPELADASTQNLEGRIFERFFGAIVNHFMRHPNQAVLNARWIGDNGSHSEELDLVVNSAGRIVIFDLKLSKLRNAFIDQLAKVSDAVRRLGGISATGVLVRPDEYKNHTKELAKHFGPELWIKDDMPFIIELLERVLKIPVPDDLKPLNDFLKKKKEETRQFFVPLISNINTSTKGLHKESGPCAIREDSIGILNLRKYVDDVLSNYGAVTLEFVDNMGVMIVEPKKEKSFIQIGKLASNLGLNVINSHSWGKVRRKIVFTFQKEGSGSLPDIVKKILDNLS